MQRYRKVRLAEYLEKIENLRKFKRFSLVNQHVDDNFVYFPDVVAINVLKELLRYHNTGEMPSDYTTKGGKRVKDTKFDFTVYEHREFLMSQRGPDGSGWFTSRCPGSASITVETPTITTLGSLNCAFKCFSGCESWKIIEWFNAMLNDREPKFVKGDTPNEILDYFKEE